MISFSSFHTLYVLCTLLTLNDQVHPGSITIENSDSIFGTNHIAFFVPSYPVGVVGNRPAIKFFPKSSSKKLRGSIVKVSMNQGTPRGVPPYNWVKFHDSNGNTLALFVYKTVNYCNVTKVPESRLFDHISVNILRHAYGGESSRPEDYVMSRTAIGRPLSVHSLSTDVSELYLMERAFTNFTHLPGAHSDVRVIPFARHCRSFQASPALRSAHYLFTGSVNDHHWHEKQFLAVLNADFDIIFAKVLVDSSASTSRTQKNWLPFWDGCKLVFSKLFGPEHVVSEFSQWHSSSREIDLSDTVRTRSPAVVPSEYLIRGSAPVISHPLMEPGYLLGCVHLRSKSKVYRHALYVMEAVFPYRIVSFSPLFAFKPLRDIEFVMSLGVQDRDGSLELTHGSMDCEPRLAVFPIQKLKEMFVEYFKLF